MNKIQLKSFIRGSAVSMVGVGTLGIMNYFIRRTMALNLSETDFGFFYSAFALVMLILTFIDLGLRQATTILLTKSFTEKDQQQSDKIFTITFIIKLSLALVVFIIMAALSPLLMKYYFKYPSNSMLLVLIFLLIPVQTIESAFAAVIIAKKAFVTQNILMNLKILLILLGIYFWANSYGFKGYIIWFIAPSLITIILGWQIIRHYNIRLQPFKTLKRSDLQSIFSLSLWIAISTAGVSLMYYMDTICLTWLTDLKAVAMYNVALPIMQIAQSFFVFPAIFTPHVAEMWQQKNYQGIKRSCLIGNLTMLATLPLFIILGYYFAADIIILLFDEKYLAAAPAVTILWTGMVFFSIARFNISALNTGGRQKIVTYIVIASVIVNFLLNIILIPKFNFTGAALATATTYLIMAIITMFSLMRTISKY